MAFFDSHFFSDVLGMNVSVHVLLPQATQRQIGVSSGGTESKYRTLYLLHGLSDDHTIWLRRTSIERYAAARNLAVVMPAVGRSFYQDMAIGQRYWSYVSEELPPLMESFFPLSSARQDRFAAGLSMGGYGALRLGLEMPSRYAAVASLSGAIDMERRAREAGREGSALAKVELEAMFGPELQVGGTAADLFRGAEQIARLPGAERPRVYLACGTEDALLRDSQKFHQHLEVLGYPHAYRESPGTHEWGYWDAEIQPVMDWMLES